VIVEEHFFTTLSTSAPRHLVFNTFITFIATDQLRRRRDVDALASQSIAR
jgi:hypothetical protein